MNKHAGVQRRPELRRLVVLVGLALPLLAQAQEADQSTTVLPQIVVTAEKLGDTTEGSASYTTGKARTATPLNLSLRDTPQSISVVTLQRIEDQGLQTVTDVINNATGVSVNQYETNRAGFTSRGFDIDNLQIDGIPTTYEASWSAGEVNGSLAPYDHVEIVRGATGLMTGAGNPSAAINLVHKRATSKELTGSAEIGIGSWNERRALVDVSTPLNAEGTVRGRVVGEYVKGDSWVDALSKKSQTIYATVEADLTPKTLLSAGFSHQKSDQQGTMWGGLPFWYTDGSKTNWDTAKTTAAAWTRWPSTYDNAFAKLEHTFDNGWSVNATASHGERKANSYLLYLYGVPDRATGLGMAASTGSYQTETKQDDIGLHASGAFALGGRKHEAAFGYMHSKQNFNSNSRSADFGSASAEVGNFNTWDASAFPEPTWSAPTFYEKSVTKQDAVYGVARFSLVDPLKLILGARVTNYEKSGYGVYTTAYDMKYNHEVTPYAGLVYDINEHYSAYASYTSIFQPQSDKDLAGNYLDPIKGKSSELGLKGEFFERKLNVSGAVFQIKQDNLAQAVGTVDRDGSGPLIAEAYYAGAKGAKSEGFEFELSGELASGWNGTAGYTQYRAKDANGAEFNSIYPRQLFRVYTTYRLPNAFKHLTLGGGVNWEGSTWTADPSAPSNTNGRIEQKSFSVVSLMARYEISKNLSAQVNINNLFDKTHFGMFAAYAAITYAAPRNAAVSLKYSF